MDFTRYSKEKFDHSLEKISIFDIQEYFKSLLGGQHTLLGEVVKVVQLVLVMPATNTTSERSFSALRRVKTYLRSTMRQEILNHLLVLHVHKERSAALSLASVAEKFVAGSEHRLSVLGKFK